MNSKTIKRLFIILVLSFAVIFILRFIYEISYYWGRDVLRQSSIPYTFSKYDGDGGWYPDRIYNKSSISNVATERQIISSDKGIEINYDQKYEMISEIKSNSEDFDNDVNKVRQAISNLNGVVQMEYTSGLEKNNDRALWISVGVTPSKFDLLVEDLKTIGNLTNFSVNKTDKTAEFNSYLAQRESLEKTLESYNVLKAQGGSIADLLILEEKIIQTEKEIIQMGVTLGLYDENQSMCTVDFTLGEYSVVYYERGGIEFYMIIESASEALGWTLMAYVAIILFVMFTGFAALGGAFILSRITKNSSGKNENDDSQGKQ